MGFSPRDVKGMLSEKKRNATEAFKSWEAFKRWVMVPDTALDEHSHSRGSLTWSNVDLDPTPPEKRNWKWWNCQYS
jgi:nucleobase:cation symporter-1, NCS1 family